MVPLLLFRTAGQPVSLNSLHWFPFRKSLLILKDSLSWDFICQMCLIFRGFISKSTPLSAAAPAWHDKPLDERVTDSTPASEWRYMKGRPLYWNTLELRLSSGTMCAHWVYFQLNAKNTLRMTFVVALQSLHPAWTCSFYSCRVVFFSTYERGHTFLFLCEVMSPTLLPNQRPGFSPNTPAETTSEPY